MNVKDTNELLFFRALHKLKKGSFRMGLLNPNTKSNFQLGMYELFSAAVYAQYKLKTIKDYKDTINRLVDAYRSRGELPIIIRKYIERVIAGELSLFQIGEKTAIFAV